MFRMLIHPSSGACDLFVELFHGLYCSGSMCVGVTLWFGWGGVVSVCRLKHCFSLKKRVRVVIFFLYFFSLHSFFSSFPLSCSPLVFFAFFKYSFSSYVNSSYFMIFSCRFFYSYFFSYSGSSSCLPPVLVSFFIFPFFPV